MAFTNLVPLQIDKETGKVVASHHGVPFSLGGAIGYIHEQTTTELIWTITHNVGSIMLLPQVFDIDYNIIVPDNIKVIDINTVEVTFASPQDGFVHIIFFDLA